MAETGFDTNNALTVKAWEKMLFIDTVKESYFSRFMGENANSIVQVKTNLSLSGNKGDTITFGIRMRLEGDGVTSGQTLEGNEQDLTTHSDTVSLERYRQAVKDDGALSRQRVVFDLNSESRSALQDWGTEKIDQLCFDAIIASPTKIFYAGTATSTATLTATDLIDTELISRVRTWAKTGGNRTQTPIRPVKVDGKNTYVLLVHPDVAYDLKQDSTYNQANREAQVRGAKNPIFTGALGVWDDVVIHEHENIEIELDWGVGGNIPGARCILMGAQALCWAWGERPSMVSKKFDYEEKWGHAWRMTAGVSKLTFNGADYGMAGVYVARTSVSDA